MELVEANNELINVLRELYPQLSDSELCEAERTLTEQMKITARIYERLQNNPELQERYSRLKEEYRSRIGLDGIDKSISLNAPRNGAD